MDKAEQLLSLIKLAEEHGFKLTDGLESSDFESSEDNIRNDDGRYSIYLGRHYDIERILFDPEFHEALWRSKDVENADDIYWANVYKLQGEDQPDPILRRFSYKNYSLALTAISPDRIEYLVKTFLEK